jgi:TRAP-type uncharacterized transport system substrate-binding protein
MVSKFHPAVSGLIPLLLAVLATCRTISRMPSHPGAARYYKQHGYMK